MKRNNFFKTLATLIFLLVINYGYSQYPNVQYLPNTNTLIQFKAPYIGDTIPYLQTEDWRKFTLDTNYIIPQGWYFYIDTTDINRNVEISISTPSKK